MTIGWIHDDIMDHWGRHQDTKPYEPPTYSCPYCYGEFKTLRERQHHIGLSHPLDIPMLLLREQRANNVSTIRVRLSSSEIRLVNTSECHVQDPSGKWRRFSKARLPKILAEQQMASWNIRLTNRRHEDGSQAKSTFTLRFSIPSEEDMLCIDSLFVEYLTASNLTHDHIENFRKRIPDEKKALDYAGALVDYALGVMFKEGNNSPYSPLGFSEFTPKMKSAMNALTAIDRPVSQTVCSCIRINLNYFSSAGQPRIAPKLQLALHFFEFLSFEEKRKEGTHPNREKRKPICPIDEITDKILEAVSDLSFGRRIQKEMYGLAKSSDLSEQDIVKIQVICCYDSLQAQDDITAKHFLHKLRLHRSFGKWAKERIQQLNA